MPIFHRIYEFYKLFYQYLQTFPKKDRYALGQKCENLILDVLELILFAAQSSKEDKLGTLEKASVKLNILKTFIRLTKEFRILDLRKYIILQENLNEIGRMLGGWIKSIK